MERQTSFIDDTADTDSALTASLLRYTHSCRQYSQNDNFIKITGAVTDCVLTTWSLSVAANILAERYVLTGGL